jgi:hypothetical protein
MTDLEYAKNEIEREGAIARAVHQEKMRMLDVLKEEIRTKRDMKPEVAIALLYAGLAILKDGGK